VPNDLPICIRRFIEEECSDGEARITEHGASESTKGRRRRERRDARLIEQVAHATASGLDERRDAIAELRNGRRFDDGICNCPSPQCDCLLERKEFFHYYPCIAP